jgi:hypothetical protein
MSPRYRIMSPPTSVVQRATGDSRQGAPAPAAAAPRPSEERATVGRPQRDLVIASLLRCPAADARGGVDAPW